VDLCFFFFRGMGQAMKVNRGYIVGTSGYSFKDWVGAWYPEGTASSDMLAYYADRFDIVELNFTYYRMPVARTLDAMIRKVPPHFRFWIKANSKTTHEQDRSIVREYLDNISPLVTNDRLAGVLMQFPQSFHRTVDSRKYLAAALEDFASVPVAVEFRHRSWENPATCEGLRDRQATLVIPDVPDLPGLFHAPVMATSPTGYLRLHSRDAEKWYAGGAERYDYNYSREDMAAFIKAWEELAEPLEGVYVFFNNCHRGQAARNAEAFRRIVEQI